jgi:hypothetical protein
MWTAMADAVPAPAHGPRASVAVGAHKPYAI